MTSKLPSPHEWYLGFQAWIGNQPDFRPLLSFLPARAKDLRDPYGLQKIHLNAMVQTLVNEQANRMFIDAISAYQSDVLNVAPVSSCDQDDVRDAYEELAQNGYVILPRIEDDKVADMREWVSQQPVYVEKTFGNPVGVLPLAEARTQMNVGKLQYEATVNCPHLLALATDPLRLGIAAKWCETRPTILLTMAWWSFAGRPGAEDAQLFHLDLDDHQFCKFFVYMTDVGEDDGPHMYVPGSHTPSALVAAGENAEDKNLYYEWVFKKLRKTDEEVGRYFRNDPISLTGPSGTNFIAATRGIHKGLMPQTNDRLVGQVVYGVTPFLQTGSNPQQVGTKHTDNIPVSLAEPPQDFTTRYMLKK